MLCDCRSSLLLVIIVVLALAFYNNCFWFVVDVVAVVAVIVVVFMTVMNCPTITSVGGSLLVVHAFCSCALDALGFPCCSGSCGCQITTTSNNKNNKQQNKQKTKRTDNRNIQQIISNTQTAEMGMGGWNNLF